MTALLASAPLAVVAGLVSAASVRLARGAWCRVSSADEPLDFESLTIAGIPVEQIDGIGWVVQ